MSQNTHILGLFLHMLESAVNFGLPVYMQIREKGRKEDIGHPSNVH